MGGTIGSAISGGLIAEFIGTIPLVGWAVKSAGMAAKAKVIGDAVINYFRERSDLPDAVKGNSEIVSKEKTKIDVEEEE